jgi:23S rRNA pseudouridine1911/1915/1917 synthase
MCAAPAVVDVVYEDKDILVVDKPAGMLVHPAPGHMTGTLTDGLLARYPELAHVGSATRPGVVHRLDGDTSGVLVLARTTRAYTGLRRAFESHRDIEKTYLAVLHGAPRPHKGTLETLVGRKAWDARRMAVVASGGARAVTHWETLSRMGSLALVEFKIETGRMHQIRVHAAHLGHPVVGDALYGNAQADRRLSRAPKRHLLHALGLAFRHPVTLRRLSFMVEPPPDIVYVR